MQRLIRGAGCNEHLICFQQDMANTDAARPFKLGALFDQLDILKASQNLLVLGPPVSCNDFLLLGDDLGKIKGGKNTRKHAETRVNGTPPIKAYFEQKLTRDTTDVDASAAQGKPFIDEGCLHSQFIRLCSRSKGCSTAA